MAQVGENTQANGCNNGVDDNDKIISRDLLQQFQDWSKKNQNPSPPAGILEKLCYPMTKLGIAARKAGSDENTSQPTEATSSKKTETYRVTSDSKPPNKVHGFKREMLLLEKFLSQQGSADSEFKAMAIVGMPGVGKTTLCQKIFNEEKVKHDFVPRIWVCMFKEQKEDDVPRAAILKRILCSLGVEKDIIKSYDLPRLLYALHLELWGKRYLIVLDDARESDGWCERLDAEVSYTKKWGNQLSYGFPKGYGGRVIVTSRSDQVAKQLVGEENSHRLLPLSDPETCWSIYEDAIKEGGTEVSDLGLKDLKKEQKKELQKELQKKCGGLPLAAKMMGRIKSEQFKNSKASSTATTKVNQ